MRPRKVTIMGVYINSDAYPNVKFRIAALSRHRELSLQEIHVPTGVATWGRRRNRLHIAFVFFALLRAQFRAMARYIRRRPPGSLYLPYPAFGMLFLFSLLPKALRPEKIVADAFISLHDTVLDRSNASAKSFVLRCTRWLEGRAYRCADKVIVDTENNRRYFLHTFRLEEPQVVALPLSIDEEEFRQSPYAVKEPCHVVFLGTFVPLQGAEVIARAVAQLREERGIRFTLIGEGQTAADVENILTGSSCTNFTWKRGWYSSREIAETIKSADICLGIFGRGSKAQRVWPFKNYLYMAVGRPLITGDTECARELLRKTSRKPFLTVPVNDHTSLAGSIRQLARDPKLRLQLAADSHAYFAEHLAETHSVQALADLL